MDYNAKDMKEYSNEYLKQVQEEKHEVTVSELLECLSLLEQTDSHYYSISLRGEQYATLNRGESIVTTFEWKGQESNLTLGNRIVEYIVNMAKDQTLKKLDKLKTQRRNLEVEIKELEVTLKNLDK